MLVALIDLVIYLIVIDAILSWFMSERAFPKSLTSAMVNPLYKPLRKVIGNAGGLDFSPIILIVLLSVLQSFLY